MLLVNFIDCFIYQMNAVMLRQNEHMKGKNHFEIAYHTHAPKKTNFVILGKYTYPFIAETLFLCTENINNILNTQSRSYELKLSIYNLNIIDGQKLVFSAKLIFQFFLQIDPA